MWAGVAGGESDRRKTCVRITQAEGMVEEGRRGKYYGAGRTMKEEREDGGRKA